MRIASIFVSSSLLLLASGAPVKRQGIPGSHSIGKSTVEDTLEGLPIQDKSKRGTGAGTLGSVGSLTQATSVLSGLAGSAAPIGRREELAIKRGLESTKPVEDIGLDTAKEFFPEQMSEDKRGTLDLVDAATGLTNSKRTPQGFEWDKKNAKGSGEKGGEGEAKGEEGEVKGQEGEQESKDPLDGLGLDGLGLDGLLRRGSHEGEKGGKGELEGQEGQQESEDPLKGLGLDGLGLDGLLRRGSHEGEKGGEKGGENELEDELEGQEGEQKSEESLDGLGLDGLGLGGGILRRGPHEGED